MNSCRAKSSAPAEQNRFRWTLKRPARQDIAAAGMRPRRAGRLWSAIAAAIVFSTAVSPIRADSLSRTTKADQVEATVSVSSTSVQVAEPFRLELSVTAPVGTTVVLPAVPPQLGGFDVLDQDDLPDIPAGEGEGQRLWTRRLTLDSITSGDLMIPPLEVRIFDGQRSQTLMTEAIPVRVVSVLEGRSDPTQFRDIKTVVDVEIPKAPSRAWLWWTLAGIGASAVSVAAIIAVRRRRSWISPTDWALRELHRVRSSDALAEADSETVFRRLSDILRNFLELRFDIAAPVLSNDELLRTLKSGNDIRSEATVRAAAVLQLADQVRFASLQLTGPELLAAVDDAQYVVEHAVDSDRPRSDVHSADRSGELA